MAASYWRGLGQWGERYSKDGHLWVGMRVSRWFRCVGILGLFPVRLTKINSCVQVSRPTLDLRPGPNIFFRHFSACLSSKIILFNLNKNEIIINPYTDLAYSFSVDDTGTQLSFYFGLSSWQSALSLDWRDYVDCWLEMTEARGYQGHYSFCEK